jgi:YVTN family beta-propeller protein
MRRPFLRPVVVVAGLVALGAVLAALSFSSSDYVAMADGPPTVDGTRAVMFIGNNWDGTADIVDPATFEKLGRFNTIPDLQERLAEIASDPVDLGYYVAIRALVGEGNDQYADDIFSSHDGRTAFVSRPSLADVVGIDLKTNAIVWRFQMTGQRADHMAISPDGTRLLVSDSTANVVHELDTATGKKVGEFGSGDSPHESNYSKDGSHIFHASIGLVYTPADQPSADSSKGERYFQVVETGTNKILKRIDIGKVMAENGFAGYSSAVRPMAIAPDEKTAYLQLSFLHGFVVWDLVNDKPIRVVDLPIKDGLGPKESYLLDSAHHGLAISADGSRLCAAGTMSDYAAIVNTEDFSHTIIEDISKPYWSTNSPDGKYCFISASGSDEVIVVDYATAKVLTRFPVGDHPQRMRIGNIRTDYVGGPAAPARAAKAPAGLQVLRARATGGRLVLRLRRLDASARGKLRIAYRGRTFRAKVPAKRTWTVRRAVKGARPGRVTLTLPAAGATVRERVRVRAAKRPARLRITRAALAPDGTLRLRGRTARAARGKVAVTLSYIGEGSRLRRVRATTRVRTGTWALRALLPSQARDGFWIAARYGGRGAVAGAVTARRVTP